MKKYYMIKIIKVVQLKLKNYINKIDKSLIKIKQSSIIKIK